MFLFFTRVRNLSIFLFLFLYSFSLFSQESVALKNKKESVNTQFDWFVGASFSPLYTGLNKGVWDIVPYLGFLQRDGYSTKQTSSFATGIMAGVGWAFYNQDKKRISFGGEYELSYYRTASVFTFGNLDGSFFPPLARGSNFPPYTWDTKLYPPPGSQQHILMQGLEHRIGPYMKFSFVGPSFPIEIQISTGLAFNQLLSINLENYDGTFYKATVFHPNRLIAFTGRGTPSGSGLNASVMPVRTIYMNFGLQDTFQLAVYAGFKIYLANLFLGFDFASNVLYSSYRVYMGFNFNNVFFANAWRS